jgi:mannosyl-oligosaccharide alpha-1,2-mannosidase
VEASNVNRTNEEANNHMPSSSIVLAVLGSLSLEFTRLAQITGNDKYYDAIQRVINELEKWQDKTTLPGLWPAKVNSAIFNESLLLGSLYPGADEQYTLGALADSTYEYLPKVGEPLLKENAANFFQEYMLLGGQIKSYKSMYEKFIEVAKEKLFFRPMTIADEDILLSGHIDLVESQPERFHPIQQHLTCFTGGMVAIAAKIFSRPQDLKVGAKLADGCVWA